MKEIEKLYYSFPCYEKFKVVVRFNANILFDEEGGQFPGHTLFYILQEKAKSVLGKDITEEKLKEFIEHATVCIDEIDKISSKVGDKPYVPGIATQQSLLTLMEGEKLPYETTINIKGEVKKVTLNIDTGNMLFICGGAFENLYDLVYHRVVIKERQNPIRMTINEDGSVEYQQAFNLREYLRQEDLFEYGMLPQFISRFDNTVVLKDLNADDLEYILMNGEESVYNMSKKFFKKFNIDLILTEGAQKLIAKESSKYTRIGARALKDVYGRVIKEYEYDPFSRKGLKKKNGNFELVIDEEIVQKALNKYV